MKVAKVTCLVEAYRIVDRQQTLTKGQDIWLPIHEFKASADLRYAKKIGAVAVRYEVKARATRPPPPNFARLGRQPRKLPKTRHAEPAPSVNDMVEQAKDDLRGEFQGAIAQAVEEALRGVNVNVNVEGGKAEASPIIDYDRIANAIVSKMPAPQTVVGQSSTSAPNSSVPSGKVEMFIPKGIVGEHKGKVEVQEKATDGSSVEDAAAALKALRKKRKNQ